MRADHPARGGQLPRWIGDQPGHVGNVLDVEVVGGLVEHDRRHGTIRSALSLPNPHQRGGNGHQLALPAGQGAHPPPQHLCKPHGLRRRLHPRRDLRTRNTGLNGSVGQQVAYAAERGQALFLGQVGHRRSFTCF